jgi:SpoVK/Ycf46/Vps4 family AAA+-type ATPase
MGLSDLIINDKEKISWEDVVFSSENAKILHQFIKEHHYIEELKKYHLKTDNKILLHGYSGCGKTTTAKAIANALNKNISIINLSTIVNSRIGETAKNIKSIFESVRWSNSVLFLDEFDAIGKMRGNDDKDVGEMRRLVNTLIQLMDYFPDDNILIGATNHLEMIDTALVRRFQLKLEFEMPKAKDLDLYYDKILAHFPIHLQKIKRKYEISFAEVKDYIHTTLKGVIIEELERQS